MSRIHENRLHMLDVACNQSDDHVINFLETIIPITDIIEITVEKGYSKYFVKYINLYYSRFYTFMLCARKLNRDIFKIIGSYYFKSIVYRYVSSKIIDDFGMFKIFMDKVYMRKYSSRVSRIYGSSTNLSIYLLEFNDSQHVQQVQYILDHNIDQLNILAIKEYIEEINKYHYSHRKYIYKSPIYKLIKHLL
jgi:hypothetical protein